jgi:hypothetical protein
MFQGKWFTLKITFMGISPFPVPLVLHFFLADLKTPNSPGPLSIDPLTLSMKQLASALTHQEWHVWHGVELLFRCVLISGLNKFCLKQHFL